MKNKEKFQNKLLQAAIQHKTLGISTLNGDLQYCGDGLRCQNCVLSPRFSKSENYFKCFKNFNANTCDENFKHWCESEYEGTFYQIPSDTPIDTKVYVSNDNKIWRKGYFAGYQECKPTIWHNGTTSWSVKYCDVDIYEYIKLAEEKK